MTPKELVLAQFPGRVYITLVEAGQAIGLSVQSCYNRHHEGTFPLPVHKVGRKPMVSLVELIDYMTRASSKDLDKAAAPPPPRRRGRPRAADREK